MGAEKETFLYKALFSVLFVGLMTFFFVQFLFWGHFAFQVTSYQIRGAFWGLSVDDRLDWGAICNSLKKYSCSEQQFQKVLEQQPRHQTATANLAIALTHQGRESEAIFHYEDYFNRGGRGLDVMHWYARSLVQIQDHELALMWYYRLISSDPEQALSSAASELVDLLVELQRPEEAISLVGAMTQGSPEDYSFWAKKLRGLFAYTRAGGRAPASQDTLFLPTLDARSHYLPLLLEGKEELDFFVLDRQGILARQSISLTLPQELAPDPNTEVGEILLLQARLGPWVLDDLRVEICEGCVARINPEALEKIPIVLLRSDGLPE